MKQVIGYKYKTITSDFLKSQGIKSNELIGTKVQLCFGRVVSETKLKEDSNPDDILDAMISKNIGVIKAFDEENFVADVIFENPIPEDIFFQYYGKEDNSPIYQE